MLYIVENLFPSVTITDITVNDILWMFFNFLNIIYILCINKVFIFRINV